MILAIRAKYTTLLLILYSTVMLSFVQKAIKCSVNHIRCLHLKAIKTNNDIFRSGQTSLIITNHELNQAVDKLSTCDEIALDLEFDRNAYSYGFNLCLIQIHGHNHTYLIDPLAPQMKLDNLYKHIFENKDILKVFHSPSEDLRLLHTLNCYPVNLFDTERCAKLLNFQHTGLSSIVQELLNLSLDKGEQKSNWIKRPLSPKQLEYARNDVLFLLPLKQKMLELGEEKKIISWFHDENNEWNEFKFIPKSDRQLASAKDERVLSPYQLYIFNALLYQREQYAKQLLKPPHYIIPKDYLFDCAKNSHEVNKLNLHQIKGIHPLFRNIAVSQEFEYIFREAKRQAKEMNLPTTLIRESLENINIDYYLAIRERIAELYGNHTANYILPVNLMKKLIFNETYLYEITTPYRRDLIRTIRQEVHGTVMSSAVHESTVIGSSSTSSSADNNSTHSSSSSSSSSRKQEIPDVDDQLKYF